MKLADKVTLSLSVLVLILLIVSWMGLAIVAPTAMQYQVLQERQTAARTTAYLVETYIQELRNDLHLINREGAELLTEHRPDVLEAVSVTPDGSIRSAAGDTGQLNTAIQQANWFVQASAGKEYLSPLLAEPNGSPYIILSQQEADGQITALRLNVYAIWDLLARQGEQVYITQADGNLIAHFDVNRQNRPLSEGEYRILESLSAYNGSSWQGEYKGLNGDTVLGAVEPIRGTPWSVVTEVERTAALRDVLVMFYVFGAVTFGVALVVLVAGRLITQKLIAPLKKLEQSTLHIAEGDFSERVDIPAQDEVGHLAQTFNRMAASIESRDHRLRTLSQHVIEAQEEERRRLSLQLQDGIGQILASTRMMLELGTQIEDETRRLTLLENASRQLEQAIEEMHALSENLRPTILDNLGIKQAVEWLASTLPVPVECELENISLTGTPAITAYRFFQEAFINVLRHASATQVTVKMHRIRDTLVLIVKDNGNGFSAAEISTGGYTGLAGIQERLALIGGTLDIQSDNGTTLTATMRGSDDKNITG